MRMEVDPYGHKENRVRFHLTGPDHIDVTLEKDGSILVHSDGFSGALQITPRISNEVRIYLAPRV